MTHPIRLLSVSIAILVITACGVQKEYRVVPTGNQTRIDVQEQVAAAEVQRARLLLRVSDGGPVEARLSEPLACERTGVMQVEQIRLEERSLSTGGKVAMWFGYAGAAAVVGLFGAGIANGSDAKSGFTIMGIYGLPLAGLGVGQSLAARDREHPAPPTTEEVALERASCREPDDGWRVQLRRDGNTATLQVGSHWMAVDTADRDILPAGYETFEGIAEAAWPVSLEADVVYAKADDALHIHIAQRIGESPESEQKPSPILAASVENSAEEQPAPEPMASEPACPEVRRTEAGVLPAAFFNQPVRIHTVVENDWLSLISRDLLGDPMQYPVLFLLNGEQVRNVDRIFPGQQIQVPTEPRTLQSWLDDVPPACRNGRNER